MFSRRHPILFFLMVTTGICAGTVVVVSLVLSSLFAPRGGTSFPSVRGDLVGVVEATGIIYDSRQIIEDLKAFREDDSIKAIVLRVDSPGGTVGPAQEIYREIQKTIDTKKVVVSMGTVAASGGYYIASAASGIMANPGTITGSIGVIMEYTNWKTLFEKIGLSSVVIKSGDFKDIGSSTREMSESEKALLQGFVDKTRRQFVQAVADGRKLPFEKVDLLADGRMYTGEDAKENGLVDRLGNLEDAVTWAGRMVGIQGEVTAVYPRQAPFSFLEELMGAATDSLFKGAIKRLPSAAYLMP